MGAARCCIAKAIMPSKRKLPEDSASEDDDLSESESESEEEQEQVQEKGEEEFVVSSSDSDEGSVDDEEAGKAPRGFSAAYNRAFSKIMKKSVPDTSLADSLGPVLAENKKLVAKKLEEASQQTTNPEASKEKKEMRELGHVLPLAYTTAHEKTLIKVATRGVVLLFNAINKAQRIQSGVASDSSKVVRAVAKKSKAAFLAELKGVAAAHSSDAKKSEPSRPEDVGDDEEEPGWAVLKDNFLLNKSKLKDWDKKADTAPADDLLRTFDDQSDGGSD